MTALAPQRVWLPLAVSLALHALLGIAVLQFAPGPGAHARGPVPVDIVALDDGGTIILDGPSRSAAAPGSTPEESEEPWTVTVRELPVVARVPSPQQGTQPGTAADESHSPGGAGGGTGLLGAPAAARSVVYVIDRSLSMGLSGALPLAKRELLAGLAALPADARFGVILYNRRAEPLSPDLLPATEADRAAAARLVEGTRAEGGTDHLAALRRAIVMAPEVIFFVTDADEMTADQVRGVVRLNRGRSVIHAVELSDEGQRPEETPLKLLARLTGGSYRLVPLSRAPRATR
jgi:hypothetical protein